MTSSDTRNHTDKTNESSYWAYRVFNHAPDIWSIEMVLFDKDGQPCSHTTKGTDAGTFNAFDRDDLEGDLIRMMQAFDHPTLTPDDFDYA